MSEQATRDFDVLSFGEVMLRLSPSGKERIGQSDVFEKCAGGSELNVVSGISQLGLRTGLITKLPDNLLGHYIQNKVRFCGVSDDHILFDESPHARLGVYYYEGGVYPRKPSVVYDRQNSAFCSIQLDEIPENIFHQSRLFHTSGISLALGDNARAAAIHLIRGFKQASALISFDVNYRATLWSEAEARAAVESILPFVDILFVSEETSRRMFAKTGPLQDIMKSYTQDYPIRIVATTERQIISPSRHNFGSMIYSRELDAFFTEPPYANIEVIDRIGSGDAYVSGVLFGYLKYHDCQKALEFGNAMSSVKNTIPGDLTSSSFSEISKTISDHRGGGTQSEMNR